MSRTKRAAALAALASVALASPTTASATTIGQRVYANAKLECRYMRLGNHMSRRRAVALVRGDVRPQYRRLAELGCDAAYGR
jgi:uncharacterized heparinase superfamily protein